MQSQSHDSIGSSPAGQTICILGCAGFIGSHLVERLLTVPGITIIGVDITPGKIRHLVNTPGFEFHCMDVHDCASLEPLIRRSSTVISLVALCNPVHYNTIPLEVIETNFTKPAAVVQLCTRMGVRLIQFSTSEVYGKSLQGLCASEGILTDQPRTWILSEERSVLALGPVAAQRWSYAAAKQLLERQIYACGHEQGLDYTIVRPFNFIGPRMDFLPGIEAEGTPRVLACFVAALLQAKPLQLVDGGTARRCFTAIGDAIDAIAAILANPRSCRQRIFNIGNPANELSIRELAQRMAQIYTRLVPQSPPTRFEDVDAAAFYGPGYEDSDRRVPDISAISQCTGWSPHIGVNEMLSTTLQYYIERYPSCGCPDRVSR